MNIPQDMVCSWLDIVQIATETLQVSAAFILRAGTLQGEVLVSHYTTDNPDHTSQSTELDIVRYCERVISRKSELLIPNAAKNAACDEPQPKSSITAFWGIPLIWPNGSIFGVVCVIDDKENHFCDIHKKLMQKFKEMIESNLVSLKGTTAKRQDETSLRHDLEKMRQALGGIIHAMALTVEARDPSTAGHQQRVANLARAIADDMGLSEEQIDGIRIAAAIHDLGKTSVPAELLSKPDPLTPAEYDIIKIHTLVGYDILKPIEFPWPIARIVLQHHEKLDGSGYPAGLTGKDILMEARILAVADVVEHMSANRPDQPAGGINDALEHIAEHRGSVYDAEVVDTCTKLFREEGFRFSAKDVLSSDTQGLTPAPHTESLRNSSIVA